MTMHVTGRNGEQGYDFTFNRDLRQAAAGDEQIASEWALWKLYHLYSRMLEEGQSETIRRQIDQLRRQYKLKTSY